MNLRRLFPLALPALFAAVGIFAQNPPAPPAAPAATVRAPRYETRAIHDPNGIGKFYMGREIAHVMGHQGASWLEREEREQEEQPEKLIHALGLKPGDVVADIGAGTGYFSRRIARHLPKGKVLAVEIQKEMLTLLDAKMKEVGVTNVQGVLGTITDPKLPAGAVDLVLMVDVYHEFSHPHEMIEGICRGLKPGGRVVFVEYRAEDPNVPIKEVHKMSVAQVRKEAAVHPLEWVETLETLPRQHIIIFRKKGEALKSSP